MKNTFKKIVKNKISLLCLIVVVFIIGYICYGSSKTYKQINVAEAPNIKASETTVPTGYKGIYTPEDFINVSNDTSANYILMDDIDMLGYTYEVPKKVYTGIFDGNYHKISNLTIESPETYVGIFGIVREGTIKNLTLENEIVKGISTSTTENAYIGGIAGRVISGTIEGVRIIGTNKIEDLTAKGANSTGGLVGYYDGDIVNCYVEAEIKSVRICWRVNRYLFRRNCGKI